MNWIKSSLCATDKPSCVEVMHDKGAVRVRDSKNPGEATLVFTGDEWDTFIAGAKVGEFDRT